MVIRIPATLVALALALALDAGTFALARFEPLALAPIVLLPLWAGAGGFRCSARWRDTNAPAPGLAVGLLLVASQFGAALGPYPELLALLDPRLLLPGDRGHERRAERRDPGAALGPGQPTQSRADAAGVDCCG